MGPVFKMSEWTWSVSSTGQLIGKVSGSRRRIIGMLVHSPKSFVLKQGNRLISPDLSI